MFPEPPKVELPNLDILASLVIDPREELVITKSDMDNFYHRLEMPSWLRQYFGLPAITNDASRKVWPVVCVLPMGWSHSAYVGQAIHEKIVGGRSVRTRVANK